MKGFIASLNGLSFHQTNIYLLFRFKAKDPVPDPRYPGDQQLMVSICSDK